MKEIRMGYLIADEATVNVAAASLILLFVGFVGGVVWVLVSAWRDRKRETNGEEKEE